MSCNCQRCGKTIHALNAQMVMIKDIIWLSIVKRKAVLCPKCIESKLGRGILLSDLKTNVPVNIRYIRRIYHELAYRI